MFIFPMMTGVHIQLWISILTDLGADPEISTPVALTKVAPSEFMADCSCTCEPLTQNPLAGVTNCFGFHFQDKKAAHFFRHTVTQQITRNDRPVTCHVFWGSGGFLWVHSTSQLPGSNVSAPSNSWKSCCTWEASEKQSLCPPCSESKLTWPGFATQVF